MGGGGGESGAKRFAAYVESEHKWLVDASKTATSTTYTNSPYNNVTVDNPEDAFFGTGKLITSYSALFSLYENFAENVDVDSLYDTILNSSLTNPVLGAAVYDEGVRLDNEITQRSLPKINQGKNDVNIVMSTGFLHGKELIKNEKGKAINKFEVTLKSQASENAAKRWEKVLQWRLANIDIYNALYKSYWITYYEQLELETDINEKNVLWPFTVYDMHRANVGALARAAPSAPGQKKMSKGASAASGALSGAMIGSQFGGGYGIVIGAVVGGIAGYLTA